MMMVQVNRTRRDSCHYFLAQRCTIGVISSRALRHYRYVTPALIADGPQHFKIFRLSDGMADRTNSHSLLWSVTNKIQMNACGRIASLVHHSSLSASCCISASRDWRGNWPVRRSAAAPQVQERTHHVDNQRLRRKGGRKPKSLLRRIAGRNFSY